MPILQAMTLGDAATRCRLVAMAKAPVGAVTWCRCTIFSTGSVAPIGAFAHPYEYPSPFPLQAAVNYHGRFIGLHGCTNQLLLVLSRQIKSSELPVINSILISSTCSGVMHDILLGILLIGICYLNIGVLILKLCMHNTNSNSICWMIAMLF